MGGAPAVCDRHGAAHELLPIQNAISVSSVKRRVRVVGAALEKSATTPSARTEAVPFARRRRKLSAVAVDSAWLRHCDPPRELGQGRHVNVVAGRACFEDDQSRVCAYVLNQVSSAAERLDGFLRASGVDPNARVTILTDGAGEFEKAAKGCAQPTCRILDWFHIAMKFEAAETSVFGCNVIDPLEREAVQRKIRGAKWLAWHGKGTKAVARIEAVDAQLLRRPDYEFSRLRWNLRNVSRRKKQKCHRVPGASPSEAGSDGDTFALEVSEAKVSILLCAKQVRHFEDARASGGT